MQTGPRRSDSGFEDDRAFVGPSTGRVNFGGVRHPSCPPQGDPDLGQMVKHRVDIVRVYGDSGRQGNEQRVLVDRLWPRGLAKAAVDHDEWVKDATPSTELRRWYGHDPERFLEFAQRYRAELALQPAADVIARLRKVSSSRRLVFLTATRHIEHSGATVLRDVLVGKDES